MTEPSTQPSGPETPPSGPKPPAFQLTLESPEPCRRIIKVQVPRSEYERQYQKRLTAAVREHQRPGFRKGKTPRPIVEKELGSRLRADAFESLVPPAYRSAVIEHRLHPLTEPTLENLVFEDGQDLSFDLVVEVRPEVTARDYEGLPVQERQVEITGAEIDEVLERLRENRAIYEHVERPAADGDQVVLDLVPLAEDGSDDTERRADGQTVTVGAPENLPVFNEVLLGAEAGQVREASVDYPEDYPNPELKGRTMVFRVEVGAVQAKVLPTVDDAFAAQLQEGQTLLELRGNIREGLTVEARRRVAEELDQQILDQLIERNEVPVPPSMVEAWLQSGIQDLQRRQQQMGRELSEEETRQYREAAQPVAEHQIKGLFLLSSVRSLESIEVTADELEARIEAIAAEHGFDLQKYRAFLEEGEEKDRIRQALLERKTYDFLLSRAKVTQMPADVAGSDPGAGTAPEADQEQG